MTPLLAGVVVGALAVVIGIAIGFLAGGSRR